MHSFVHVEYRTRHAGVERFERVLAIAASLIRNWNINRSLASVLLVAMVAALLVVADQLIHSWADGHLLAAWVLLWALGFTAIALLAPTAMRVASRTIVFLNGWSQSLAQRRADERLWDMARRDPRLWAELQAAATRAEAEAAQKEARRAQPAALSADENNVQAARAETLARLQRLNRRIWND